jgi:hypothetical protein
MAAPVLSFGQAKPARLPDPIAKRTVLLEEKSRTFPELIAALSAQLETSIVVDGEPTRKNLTFIFRGSAQEAVERFTDYFDLTWKLHRSGAVLMNRRFKHIEETPQWHHKEIVQTMKEVSEQFRLLSFDPNAHPYFYMTAFYQSCTPAQQEKLRAGGALGWKELTPQQKSTLQQASMHNSFSPLLRKWDWQQRLIEGMPDAYLQVRDWPGFYYRRMNQPIPPELTKREVHFMYVVPNSRGEEITYSFPMKPVPLRMKEAGQKVEVRTP